MLSLHQLSTFDSTRANQQAVSDFVREWFGAQYVGSTTGLDWKPDVSAPEVLLWWYVEGGQRIFEKGSQNVLLKPSLLKLEEDFDEWGEEDEPERARKLVFYGENQGCYEWATEASGADPPVWGREGAPLPWTKHADHLSAFLLQTCLFEAVVAPKFGHFGFLEPEAWNETATVLQLRQLPFTWHWPGYPTRFWAGPDAVAVTNPGATAKKLEVYVAVTSTDKLGAIDGIGWET